MTGSGDKKSKIWIIPIIILLIAILATVCFFTFRPTETRETGNKETYSIGALICEADSPSDAFFSLNAAVSNKHNIKITLKDGVADKISYGYVGDFGTEALAENVSSTFHGKYNIDMSDHGLDPENLAPTFVATEKNVKINLYAAVDNLNTNTAKFFFLTPEEQKSLKTYSEKTIQDIYKNVGFECKYNN